jgi:hypothetical protein
VADIDPSYRLGVGELRLDLADVELPSGPTDLRLRVGMGHVEVRVPDDVCVQLVGHVGAGEIALFDDVNDGLDVTVDHRAGVTGDDPVLVVDARAGVGRIDVVRSGFGAGGVACPG